MDQKHQRVTGDPVVITGIGVEAPDSLLSTASSKKHGPLWDDLSHDCRPLEFLKQKKTLKFMSKQDRLAVNAAGRAIATAGLTEKELHYDTGVFLTVGYIPFEFDIATELCSKSMEAGEFSMEKFSTDGIDDINPLIAFACLPNMPAHHIAMNFGINGEYLITYPDILQLYLTMEEAICRLEEGRSSFVLLGGVADQNNFLVANHFKKTAPSLEKSLADSAAFMVIEKESSAKARKAPILARLDSLHICAKHLLTFQADINRKAFEAGPAQLAIELFEFINHVDTTFSHSLTGWGNNTHSTWTKPC